MGSSLSLSVSRTAVSLLPPDRTELRRWSLFPRQPERYRNTPGTSYLPRGKETVKNIFTELQLFFLTFREESGSQLTVSPLQGGVVYPTSLSSSSSSPPPPLSLPPNGSLYLGGSPSLVVDGYSGCLDRVVINNNLIPLLLPDVIEGQPLQLCGPR